LRGPARAAAIVRRLYDDRALLRSLTRVSCKLCDGDGVEAVVDVMVNAMSCAPASAR